MKKHKIVLLLALTMLMFSCKKKSPLEDLGTSTGKFNAQLAVSLSNRTPLVGEAIVVTATTGQRNDKIAKVEFIHTLSERFGVQLSLDNATINTWSTTNPTMVLRDTIAKEIVWNTVNGGNGGLNNYYITTDNNYVVPMPYTLFVQTDGKYKLTGSELLLSLPDESFEIIKSQLTFVIGVADYSKLFPGMPDTHYVIASGVKTGVSALGKTYLRENLTRNILISNGMKEIRKKGMLVATVTVRVTTEAGAQTSVSNSFESVYQ
ncbi:hypothetical protein LPB86_04395 [Pedobacter sp. MC2016-14]|uniref:hypothetical protein n=1 Tax=Pedobacter sp. MC2016-14 TaxID=2897327 RepID=UPI001E2F8B9A|nr:hypothetical protein [Pedobacter sp. MC2016-14]MCD0487455.1 hypothetical protein [Pedobacter sp. MC2016-14]